MVDSVNTNYTGGAYTSDPKGKSTLGKDDFMKLMIAQMKYQDPMSPMDSSAFSAQLAQFSSLEQLTNLNENVTKSIDANYYLTQSINNTMTATLIGKDVKLSGSEFYNKGQESVTLGFNMPSAPTSTTIKVYNEAGTLVKTIVGENFKSGDNKLSWDFTDNQGNRLPEGKYNFEVEATGFKNDSITASKFMYGTINGVKFGDSGTVLIVDGVEYPLSNILEVINPPNEGGGD